MFYFCLMTLKNQKNNLWQTNFMNLNCVGSILTGNMTISNKLICEQRNKKRSMLFSSFVLKPLIV